MKAGSAPARVVDELASEEPLEIRVDTRPISVTMRTPGNDEELAAGFLLAEGIVKQRGDIVTIKSNPRNQTGNVIDVFLAPRLRVDFSRLTRHVFASASCGLCGKATISAVHQRFKPVRCALAVKAETVQSLVDAMHHAQETFARTGGLHAAAIFDRRGRLILLREDIGRHNAVDKALGVAFLQRLLPLSRHVLLVSGRASFEIMQKALAARIPIVCAFSAPSSLAVEFACASRQTLVGFLRSGTMNIYSHAERIVRQPSATRP